ncbi:MAG: NADH-quinone oxidoreductase subunit NuoF [Candidatus Thermoplasmatota archaeon]
MRMVRVGNAVPDVPTILVCQGASGLSAGALGIMDAFEEELKKHSSHPSLSRGYRVKRVGDRGLFIDPLVDVLMPDGSRTTYARLTLTDVPKIVEQHIFGGRVVEECLAGEDYTRFFEGQQRIVLRHCGEIDPEDINDYVAHGGFTALRRALSMTPEQVIDLVKASGLRGRGGAGFPTGLKWGYARAAKGTEKYVICNADEGDPGAFMDRSLLEGDPMAVIEGMIIAAHAIGAGKGFVYCRAEYPLAVERVTKAIENAENAGYLGKKILGTGHSFEIALKEGAGAFVCGEETALIASIEGRRGEPRPRPPFPAESGLWGKPTIINNVETLATIPLIIDNGAEWFSAMGTEHSKGTKVFALAGRVKRTGLVEVPMGTSLRQVIFGPGGGMARKGRGLKAVQIGGPSGGCLPASALDTPIDYETITATGAIMGSGGMVVMDEGTCMVDIARYFLSFTVKESCGKCVPCRMGLKQMLDILNRIAKGEGSRADLERLERIAKVVKETALCGLGQTAPNPVLTTLRYFRDEYEAHITGRCHAAVCTALTRFEVDPDRCKMCGRCSTACPVDAVSWAPRTLPTIDKKKCIRCRACIEACEYTAIR